MRFDPFDGTSIQPSNVKHQPASEKISHGRMPDAMMQSFAGDPSEQMVEQKPSDTVSANDDQNDQGAPVPEDVTKQEFVRDVKSQDIYRYNRRTLDNVAPVHLQYPGDVQTQSLPQNRTLNTSSCGDHTSFLETTQQPEPARKKEKTIHNLLQFKKFYTNRNFNFIDLFTVGSKDTQYKLRFSKSMPRRNPMVHPKAYM